MSLVKVSSLEEPVELNLRSVGIMKGMPNVHVRLGGGRDMDIDTLTDHVWSFHCPHVLFTSNRDPVLCDQLPDLIVAFQTEYGEKAKTPKGDNTVKWWPGMHVTVETPACVFDEAVASGANFLSLIPDLYDWREQPLLQYLEYSYRRSEVRRKPGDAVAEVRIAVSGTESVMEAIKRFNGLFKWLHEMEMVGNGVHFVLESRRGASWRVAKSALEADFRNNRFPGYTYPAIRILP